MSETFSKSLKTEFEINPQNEESESEMESESDEIQSLETDLESESDENGVLSEINSDFFQIINSTQNICNCLNNNHIHLIILSKYNPKSIEYLYNDITTDFNDIIDIFHKQSLENIQTNAIINFGDLLINFLETQT